MKPHYVQIAEILGWSDCRPVTLTSDDHPPRPLGWWGFRREGLREQIPSDLIELARKLR